MVIGLIPPELCERECPLSLWYLVSTGESVTLCSEGVEVGLSLVRGGVEGRLAGLEYSELFNQLSPFSAAPLL